jgi:3-phosphoshikimate 1-carboxyvinyltransferase
VRLRVSGDVRVPGDKSLSHRALMFAAIGEGESRLSNVLTGADCRSTAAVLRSLGCEIPRLPEGGGELVIRSAGAAGWSAPTELLDCGNSGTTARLMMGLLAARPFSSRLTGDDSLRRRPMRRVTQPLAEMGAAIRELGEADRLPLEIRGGTLASVDHASPHASAQVKSALLLAGVTGGVEVSVLEPHPSRDHTERMLRAAGCVVTAGVEGAGWRVRAEPPRGPLPPLDLRVPGDPSSAAFLLALALLADEGEIRVREVCTNPTRIGFLDILRRMGADVTLENQRMEGDEPVADLVARPSRLRGTTITPEEIPSLVDEVPILAVLAARAEGETRVTGARELRAKESDRITAMVANLRAVGATAEELEDGLVVRGTDAPLTGVVPTHHDHRIAMAFGVLGVLPGSDIEVLDPEVVGVSFPGFWELLRALSGGHRPSPPHR